MIINALIALFIPVVDAMLNLRPAWNPALPLSLVSAIQFMEAYDAILPIHEVLQAAGLLGTLATTFTLFKWSIKVIDWIADILP